MNIRKDFPMINNEIIYFDNAATTFKPNQVINKIYEYYTKYSVNTHRGDYDLAYIANNEFENVRTKVKEFINARSTKEIIFTSGTTMSLNMIVEGYFKDILVDGDEVIISKSEHAANVLPWFKLSKTNGTVIKYCPLDENYHITMNNMKSTITDKTKVIALAHITNVIGDIRPLKEIITYAHQLGIIVVVDGAQSIGHLKVDVNDLDCDFFAFSAHKMMGPTGVGVLYGKEDLLNKMKPFILGGGMNETFDNENEVYYKELPEKLEAGTQNIASIIGMGSAIDYLNQININQVNKYESELKNYLINKLELIPHVRIINHHSQSAIIAFNIEDVFSQDVSFYLNKYHICVRAGNHCAKILKDVIGHTNSVRISLSIYNTKEEVDKLVELLQDKNKIIKEMI